MMPDASCRSGETLIGTYCYRISKYTPTNVSSQKWDRPQYVLNTTLTNWDMQKTTLWAFFEIYYKGKSGKCKIGLNVRLDRPCLFYSRINKKEHATWIKSTDCSKSKNIKWTLHQLLDYEYLCKTLYLQGNCYKLIDVSIPVRRFMVPVPIVCSNTQCLHYSVLGLFMEY